jgi:uncharacterized membrane protein YhhN
VSLTNDAITDENAPTHVGGHNAGHLDPATMSSLGAGWWIPPFALIAGIAYGVYFFRRPPSLARTVTKTAAVGLMALASLLAGLPWPLTLALTLSACGDFFLAGENERGLRFGLASFLLAHLAYVALFLAFAPPLNDAHWTVAQLPQWRFIVMAGVVIAAGGLLAWLWPSLGAMRLPVSLYVAAILAMVLTSLALSPDYEQARIGALMFLASDAILSVQLFKARLKGWPGGLAVWWLYYLGQLALIRNFVVPTTF